MWKSLLLCLALACPAYAQDAPKASITDPAGGPPPTQIDNHEGVIYLSGKEAVAGERQESLIWLVKPSNRAERIRTYENGRELVIPLGKGEYTLTITQVAIKGDVGNVAEVTIKVGNGGVDPDPTPDPTPDPDPIPPPTEEFSALVVKTFSPTIAEYRSDLKTMFAVGAVSKAYRQVAQEIEGGQIKTIDESLDKLKSMTQNAMGDQIKLWKPTTAVLEAKLQAMQPPLKDHVKIYRDIAKGIELSIGL